MHIMCVTLGGGRSAGGASGRVSGSQGLDFLLMQSTNSVIQHVQVQLSGIWSQSDPQFNQTSFCFDPPTVFAR